MQSDSFTMNNGLIPRRLTQPKTLLILVVAVVVLGLMSMSGSSENTAVKPGVFPTGDVRRSDSGSDSSSSSSSSPKGGPALTEDGNIDYCEILREPVLLNQRSHWDNFAQSSKGHIDVPDRSDGDIGNWFGTLAYFSSIDANDLENPHRFFTSCELACAQHENCVSFLYERYLTEIDNHKYIDKHKDRCYLNSRFQYGTERLPQVDKETRLAPGEVWNGRSWTAGWHRERAEKWLIEEKGCTRPSKRPSRREQREAEEREAAVRAEQEAAENARAATEAAEAETEAAVAANAAAADAAMAEAAGGYPPTPEEFYKKAAEMVG